jgi:hypothetical protein
MIRYEQKRLSPTARYLFLLFTLLPACRGDFPQVPDSEDFTKAYQERLGEKLLTKIAAEQRFLPQLPPYDTTVYWYVQTLYNQATTAMRLDMQSPPGNRWQTDRTWRIFIMDNDSLRHAFVLPGGDLFISTGMLRSFQREYELYYLLAFEAAAMHHGHLLDRLIGEYNALALYNLIDGKTTDNGLTINDLATAFPSLVFDENTVEILDQETQAIICQSSIFAPDGILPFLSNPDFEQAQWRQTWPSYPGRQATIVARSESQAASCGTFTGEGNYCRYVLNPLK